MSLSEQIHNELESLSQERVAEVLDFVRFLKKQDEKAFALRVAESSLAQYWNTAEEDEAWKNL